MRLEDFYPRKDYLVCVDSDGCAIDSMEAKHRKCFGPCLVEEWELDSIRGKALERWNEVNLYSSSRGINRFKALAIILEELALPGWREVKEWTARTPAFSNEALAKEACPMLKKAYSWSLKVNRAIELLPVPLPFDGVAEALVQIHEQADIAVVSSANLSAIESEWKQGGLADYVSVIASQQDGTKSACIKKLLAKGYFLGNVLMVGDAPGDWQAALENEVSFYPIIPGKEAESWHSLKNGRWEQFCAGTPHANSWANELQAFKIQLKL